MTSNPYIYEHRRTFCDARDLPPCGTLNTAQSGRRDVPSSGILRSIEWQSFTDVSGQHIGPIFKGQEAPHFSILEDEAHMFSRNVGKGLSLDAE
jgi:hypothetical protein